MERGMRKIIILTAVTSATVSALATVLILLIALPTVVTAQEARLRGSGLPLVGTHGGDHIVMEAGPGGSSTIQLHDAADTTRVLISSGSEAGTNAQPNSVAIFSRDGRPIAGIGTGPQGQYVVLGDQDGDVRLLLNVD